MKTYQTLVLALAAAQSVSAEEFEFPEMLYPADECMVWGHDTTVCYKQWARFWMVCDALDWPVECKKTDEAWYTQELEWKEPDAVKEECNSHWSKWSEDDVEMCTDQFGIIERQCLAWEHGDWSVAYKWNSSCDWMENLWEGAEAFEESDDEEDRDYEEDLALAQADAQTESNNSNAYAGAAFGVIGFAATLALISTCNKKTDQESQEALL